MAVVAGTGACVATAFCVIAGLYNGLGGIISGLVGGDLGRGRVQIAAEGGKKWEASAAAPGADTDGGGAGPGDVDQSWAIAPVAVQCVSSCPSPVVE